MKMKVLKNILLLISVLVNIQFTNGKEYITNDAVIVEGVLIINKIKNLITHQLNISVMISRRMCKKVCWNFRYILEYSIGKIIFICRTNNRKIMIL